MQSKLIKKKKKTDQEVWITVYFIDIKRDKRVWFTTQYVDI